MDISSENTTRPEPWRFTDYRAYLRAMIAHLKAVQPGRFSYRYFSRRAGFSSPNFLKLVAEGDRNLSLDSVDKFARGLGLDDEERAVFELLVRLDQAADDAERNAVYARLRQWQARVGLIEADQYDLYSEWHAVVLREMVGLPGFREDEGWLGRALRPAVRATAVRHALGVLTRLGLVVRDGDGRLQQAERKISTGSEVQSLAVRNFHRNILALAARALDAIPRDRRHVSALTVPLTPAQYEAVCARVAAFRRDLLEILDEEVEGPRAVHQIQFIVFPVTEEME